MRVMHYLLSYGYYAVYYDVCYDMGGVEFQEVDAPPLREEVPVVEVSAPPLREEVPMVEVSAVPRNPHQDIKRELQKIRLPEFFRGSIRDTSRVMVGRDDQVLDIRGNLGSKMGLIRKRAKNKFFVSWNSRTNIISIK